MGLFDFLNNVPQSQNNQSQPPPVPWNTRTPMPSNSPSPSNGSSWNTRIPFTPSPPQDNTQPDPQQSDSSAAPSSGGFFSNLLNRLGGVAGVVGGKINDFENATGLNHIKGAMQGLLNPDNFNTSATPADHSWGANIMAALDRIKQAGGNVAHSVESGFMHPDEMNQNFTDTTNKLTENQDPFSKFATRLLAASGTDPLSYVPVGSIAKVLGTGIKTASDATKLTPIVNAASSALRNAPVIKPAIDSGTDFLGNLFSKYYGASPDLVSALNKGAGVHSANEYNILNTIKSMNDHGLNPNDYNDIGHVVEGTMQGTPEQQSFAQKWSDAALHGPQMPQGSPIGTNAMLHTASAVNGEPILRSQLPNYFPHGYDNVPDELKGVFPKQVQGVSGLSPDGTFNLPRTFGTLQEAQSAGLKPNLDPLQVLGNHLSQSSKVLTNNQVISDIKNAPGLLFDKDPIDEVAKLVKTGRMTADQAAQSLGMSLDDMKKGFVQSKVPQLSGAYIRPADEKALNDFLTRTPKDSAYDKAVGAWKQVSLLNSTVHGHNITYNGAYLGGAKPSYVGEHISNLFSGKTDPWVDRAMRAGAGSSDSGAFSRSLAKASSLPSTLQNVKNGAGYAMHGALWDADKAMRTSIFRQAVEGGATDTEAAAKANKFMVDYNNTTPFENSVMKRIFPFYSWMKGNLPLQAEQMINNTPKQLFAQNATNAASQAISGEDAKGGKVGTGQVLPDGSEVKIDPYMSSSEPGKVMDQGPLAFLYGRSNPILKEILSQVLNKAYYPSSSLAPTGKEGMADAAITNPEAPGGYNALKRVVHAADSLLPLNGVVGSAASGLLGDTDSRGALNNLVGLPNKDKPPTTAAELITKALGGFSSRDNPAKDELGAKYDNKNSILNHIKYEKEAGIPVSKAEKKAAYRKIR